MTLSPVATRGHRCLQRHLLPHCQGRRPHAHRLPPGWVDRIRLGRDSRAGKVWLDVLCCPSKESDIWTYSKTHAHAEETNNLSTCTRAGVDPARRPGSISPGYQSHSDTTLYIFLLIIYTKYTAWRQNDFRKSTPRQRVGCPCTTAPRSPMATAATTPPSFTTTWSHRSWGMGCGPSCGTRRAKLP